MESLCANQMIDTWNGASRLMNTANNGAGDPASKPPFKALIGWDGIMIWDRSVDPVDMLNAYVQRIAAESCGQCTPCRAGTARLADLTGAICAGRGRLEDLEQIRFLVKQIGLTARCDIGRTMSKPIGDLLDQCEDDFRAVIRGDRPVRPGTYSSIVTAPCINACPAHLDIPAYLEHVRMGRWQEAMETVRQGCPMPGTIGRVCVRPCENSCRRGRLDAPLAIRAVKRFLADREMAENLATDHPVEPKRPEKVAIVGAGPAGISCAYYLGRMGYRSTVFEAQEGPGGMAAYGIPTYRLPRNVISHEVAMAEKMGAEIRYGVKVGTDVTLDELVARGYQAIFFGVGAPESSKMRCIGEDAGYQHFTSGIAFLAEAARGRKPLEGNKLVVIGGGNVAMDCVRTARRLGFSDVNLLYRRTEAEMPADPHEIKEAKEEGVHFHELVAPMEVLAKDNTVVGLKCQRMQLGEPDDSGRRRPVPIEGSEFVIDCDAVIPAVGQVCVVDCLLPGENKVVTKWKTLSVDQTTFQSECKHIFGGGDCVTGPKTLVAALAAGKNAAHFIAQYLEKGECAPDAGYLLRAMATSKGIFSGEETFPYPGCTDRMATEVLDSEYRIHNFEEVEKGFSPAQARTEAARCLRCYRVLMSAL